MMLATLMVLISNTMLPGVATEQAEASLTPTTTALARCMYGVDAELAERFLENSDATAVSERAIGVKSWLDVPRRLKFNDCLKRAPLGLKVAGRVSVRMVREMLAEQSYLARVPSYAPRPVSPPRNFLSGPEPTSVARQLALVSDCLLDHKGEVADALLRSPAGSDAERATSDQLISVLPQCGIGSDGAQLNTLTIRGLVAEGLWQRYVAPKSAN